MQSPDVFSSLMTAALTLLLILVPFLLWRRRQSTEKAAPTQELGSLSQDRITDEPITDAQRQSWEELAATPLGKSVGRDDCLRALHTRRFHVEKTRKLLQQTAAWRRKYAPESITTAHVKNSLPSRCWVPGGVSKHGWPIIECYVGRWRPFDYDNEEQHRLIGFLFTHALASAPQAERFLVLVDMSGWTLALGMPQPLRKVLTVMNLAQNEYCERLGAVILINVPPIFQATWAILKPLIHERVAPRVALYGTDWRPSVAALIDDANLPVTMGGLRKETPIV